MDGRGLRRAGRGVGSRLLAAGLGACALAACGRAPAARPRNVVLVVIDTLRADHLETYGYARATAPHLAEFAARSVVFDRAYSHAPWTKASIASLLTSLPPARHGVVDWEKRLDDAFETLPEVLAAHGYRTEAYVSHHALHPLWNNFHQGFDTFDVSVFQSKGSHKIASSRELSDLALAALDRLQPPFFLLLHYFDPHNVYLRHPEHDFGKRPMDRYDGEIAYTDDHLGRVLAALEESGRLEDTVVCITADHGEEFEDHGGQFHTTTLYDELLHVPLVIHAPGLAPGRVPDTVGLVDVAPTLLRLAGVDVPEAFAGRAIPVVDGRLDPGGDRTIFAETRFDADKRAVIEGRWKLVRDEAAGSEGWALFDLENDPGEHAPVRDRPDVAARLRALLEGYEKTGLHAAPSAPTPVELRKILDDLGY